MVQKYQNEISPIVYNGKKLKTSGKLLKIPDLQPPDWGQPYWMTLYESLKINYKWKCYLLLEIDKNKKLVCQQGRQVLWNTLSNVSRLLISKERGASSILCYFWLDNIFWLCIKVVFVWKWKCLVWSCWKFSAVTPNENH